MAYKHQRLVLELVNRLRENGSWAGRTHVQKAAFLLNVLCGVEMPFTFILYKHGPYSFDLDSELNDMLSYGALAEEFGDSKYGAKFSPSGINSKWLRERTDEPLPPAMSAIEQLTKALGHSDTRDLEKVATAAWISTVEGVVEDGKIASKLHELKPHIPKNEAKAAVKMLRDIQKQLQSLRVPT